MVLSRPVLICVLGMHRSGTSAVTHYLHELGAAVGPQQLETISAVNADGFWEDSVVVAINEGLLAAAGRSWFDYRAWQIDAVDSESLQKFRAQAVAHMCTHYLHQPLSVIKDPRLCRLLPFWLNVWEVSGFAVRCLYTVRHPFAVAASLYRRDRLPYEYTVLLWLQYTLEALAASAEASGITVSFDAVLEQPIQLPQALKSELGITLPISEENWHNAASLSLNIGLRHNHDVIASAVTQVAWIKHALTVYAFLSSVNFSNIDRDQLRAMLAKAALVINENKEQLDVLQRISGELMQLSAETVRIGELHAQALKVIGDKDGEIAFLAQQRAQLIEDITHCRVWRLIPPIIRRVRRN